MDDKTMIKDGVRKGRGKRSGVLGVNQAVSLVFGSLAMFPSGRICRVDRGLHLDVSIPPFTRPKGR